MTSKARGFALKICQGVEQASYSERSGASPLPLTNFARSNLCIEGNKRKHVSFMPTGEVMSLFAKLFLQKKHYSEVMMLKCRCCGDQGEDGWRPGQVSQDRMGNDYYAWFCSVCGACVCVGSDCGEDEFGQVMEDDPDDPFEIDWDFECSDENLDPER